MFYQLSKCEIEPVDMKSRLYDIIQDSITLTHGPTHDNFSIKLTEIYKLTKHNETARFFPFEKLTNKRLLWHGSRMTNFVGILRKV